MTWKVATEKRSKFKTEEELRAAKREYSRRSVQRQLEKNPDLYHQRAREATARWRVKYPGRASQNTMRSRAKPKNREHFKEYRRQWRRKNLVLCLWKEARRRSKAKGIDFDIEVTDIPPMGSACPIFGTTFTTTGKSPTSPSLDRIDPKRGYVKGNVWLISYRANLIKNDGTAEEHEMITAAMRRMLPK